MSTELIKLQLLNNGIPLFEEDSIKFFYAVNVKINNANILYRFSQQFKEFLNHKIILLLFIFAFSYRFQSAVIKPNVIDVFQYLVSLLLSLVHLCHYCNQKIGCCKNLASKKFRDDAVY